MKDAVLKLPPSITPPFRVKVQNAPPPSQGWGIRHVSGADDVEPGTMLVSWSAIPNKHVDFAFSRELAPWLWETEGDAKKIVDFLRVEAGIETDAVPV